MKKKYYSRRFLNKKEGLAAIGVEGDNRYMTVSIMDCYRCVNLDFSSINVSENINKFDLLIAELISARDFLKEVHGVSDGR